MTNSRGVSGDGRNWKLATLLTNSSTAPYDRETGNLENPQIAEQLFDTPTVDAHTSGAVKLENLNNAEQQDL